MRERPLSCVPKPVLLLLAAGLALQVLSHFSLPGPSAKAQALPAPPSIHGLRAASLGEPVALAKILLLRLQSFDSQPGIQVPFRQLDYANVEAWLERMLELDPRSQYPLFMASRLYGEVADPARQRIMLELVYRRFADDPNRRWPWLAHAAVVAKHQLKDLPLARKYAQAIRLQATDPAVPGWARQMEIFVLEDMNELESAKILLGGLIESGQITDSHEVRFLKERLQQMERKSTMP